MQNQSEEKNSESIPIQKTADFVGLGMVLSNETWEHVINVSPVFIALISPDKKIRKVNRALSSFLGKSQAEIIGHPYFQVLHAREDELSGTLLSSPEQLSRIRHHRTEDAVFGVASVTEIALSDTLGMFAGCLYIIRREQAEDLPGVETELVLRSMLNAMPDPSVITDIAGQIRICSTAFAEKTGIDDHDKIEGSSIIGFISHDEIEKGLLDLGAIGSGVKSTLVGQYHMRRTGNELFTAEAGMSLLKIPGINSSFILISFRDISGELRSDELSEKNQVRLSLFNKIFQGFSADSQLNISKLTSLLAEMTGASSARFSSCTEGEHIPVSVWYSPFLSGFDNETAENIFLESTGGNPAEIQVLTRPQLTQFTKKMPEFTDKFGIKSITGIPLFPGGRYSGLITLAYTFPFQLRETDREFCSMVASAISLESMRAPLQGRESENAGGVKELLDYFTDSIFIMDEKGNILDLNAGAMRVYGYERDEIIGRNVEMLAAAGKNDLEKISGCISRAFSGESCSFEWWGVRKNGEVIPKDVVLDKGRFMGRDVVVATGRDISLQKIAEEKLTQNNQELKEINVSKDKFFSILAHDLKNPFGGLLGFIDLLYEDIDELSTGQIKEYLQNIRTASYHTYSLLENLLEWSRIQTGKVKFQPTRFDLQDEVESVIKVLEANAVRKKIRLLNLLEPGVTAEADRNMIHSITQNLVSNAIKFSNSNSDITITGRFVGAKEASNAHADENLMNRRWYELSVTDTGIGIPEDILPRLFRLDGQFSMAGTANEPGTGLGLILCKEMVEKNGGKIWVESYQSNGSTFSFTLPLSE